MKPIRIIIAVVMLLVPLAARTLWFYQGSYQRPGSIPTPDFASFTIPQPEFSTPVADQPTVAASAAAKPDVLFDLSHGNAYFLSEVETLTKAIDKQGAGVIVDEDSRSLFEHLKYATSLVEIAPTSPFSSNEIRQITAFVKRGGTLLVLTDPTRNIGGATFGKSSNSNMSSTEVTNLLLAPFEISFNDDYVYNLVKNDGNFRNVYFEQITSSPVTENLSKIVLYSAHSLRTKQTALVEGDANTFSSLTDKGASLVVAASAQENKVFALGDMTFLTLPYNQVADNQNLILNIAKFLVSGTPEQTLRNFPYLFSRPITILTPADKPIDPDMVSAMSEAQSSLEALGYTLDFAFKPEDGHDLLVASSLPLEDALKPLVAPFKLSFTKEPASTPTPAAGSSIGLPTPEAGGFNPITENMINYVSVPGLGKFETDGLGLLLFAPSEKGNTLILLAGNVSNLKDLAGMVSSGSLNGCIIQGQVAVCKLTSGSGGGFTGGG
jgi:hypothetical protein